MVAFGYSRVGDPTALASKHHHLLLDTRLSSPLQKNPFLALASNARRCYDNTGSYTRTANHFWGSVLNEGTSTSCFKKQFAGLRSALQPGGVGHGAPPFPAPLCYTSPAEH